MNGEDGGRADFLDLYPVPRETLSKLDLFADRVLAGNRTQNLISRSTEDAFWTRHLLDSAQLSELMPPSARTCLDVGSGAGLPGIVIALTTDIAVTLVEPRHLRAEFLVGAIEALQLGEQVHVVAAKVERVAHQAYDVITARAFARLSETIAATKHLAGAGTCWLLPKGRRADEEVSEAAAAWKAEFEIVPSKTASDAAIVRVTGLMQRPRR